jgi:GT2 family glycosyltransferase
MIGWVHPDMKFEDKWLSELVAAFEKYPEAGKVCSWNPCTQGEPLSDKPMPGHQQAYIIRKSVLFQIGLFNEEYLAVGGWEDIDMNRRILLDGFRVLIIPSSRVWHPGMSTRSLTDHSKAASYNTKLYRKKWGDSKDGELFY